MVTCAWPRALRSVAGATSMAGAAGGEGDCSGELAFVQHDIDQDFTGEHKAFADFDGDGLLDVIVGGVALRWYQAPHWTMHQIALAEGVFIGHMQAGGIDRDGAPIASADRRGQLPPNRRGIGRAERPRAPWHQLDRATAGNGPA